jgi:hypothetical protein
MEEGEINGRAGIEVVMEDMDYAKIQNKIIKPKKTVAEETGPELSDELRAQFSTARDRKKPKNPSNDGVKQE